MSKELGPFMPLYWDDFIGGTIDMGADEVGAYLLLLHVQWTRGSVISDPHYIERVARCEYGKLMRVLQKFSNIGGHLVNIRLAKIRVERMEYISSQREKGMLGGRPQKPGVKPGVKPGHKPGGNPEGNPDETSPSPSPSPIPYPLPKSDARAILSSSGRLGSLAQQILDARQEFKDLQPMAVVNCLRGADPETLDAHVAEFVADSANMLEPPRNPLGLLRGYLRGKPARRGEPPPQRADEWDRAYRDIAESIWTAKADNYEGGVKRAMQKARDNYGDIPPKNGVDVVKAAIGLALNNSKPADWDAKK